jgi:hypothetical protein
VIERFTALACRGDRHLQVFAHALADVVRERAWPQPASYWASSSTDDALTSRGSEDTDCLVSRHFLQHRAQDHFERGIGGLEDLSTAFPQRR